MPEIVVETSEPNPDNYDTPVVQEWPSTGMLRVENQGEVHVSMKKDGSATLRVNERKFEFPDAEIVSVHHRT